MEGVPMLNGYGDGPSNVPSTINPATQDMLVNPRSLCPFRYTQSLTIDSETESRPFIPALLRTGGPFAVFGRISKIVIDPLNGMVRRWTRSHVSIERTEIMNPLDTHGNSTTSIGRVTLSLRIVASVLHFCPCRIFQGSEHSMLGGSFAGMLPLETSTRKDVPGSKVVETYRCNVSTIAETYPLNFGAWRWINALRDKSSKSEPGDIFPRRHVLASLGKWLRVYASLRMEVLFGTIHRALGLSAFRRDSFLCSWFIVTQTICCCQQPGPLFK